MENSTPVIVIAPGMLGATVARSLGRLGIPMYGVFSDPRSPSRRSRYWNETYIWDLLAHHPERSLAFLSSLADDIGGTPILIPLDDDSCLFVARHAQKLQQRFSFPAQPEGLAEQLSSKRGMFDLCRKHGVPTARTVFPLSLADVEAYIATGSFPVMLKAIDTQELQRHAGLRMKAIENAEELRHWYIRLETPVSPNLMIQELIPGDASAVWMFDGYFDGKSRCLFGMTGQKLRQYPAYTGATSLGICVQNRDVAEITKRFMADLGYQGILDLGYKFDHRTGEYKLLDVNPRIGATFRLFVDSAGMDVARALYLDLTGQEVRTGRALEGRKWLSEVFDLASSWRYRRDGALRVGQWLASFRGVNEGMWFASDDPEPFIALMGRGARWGARRVASLPARGWKRGSRRQKYVTAHASSSNEK